MGNAIATRKSSLVEEAFDLSLPAPDSTGLREELDALVKTHEHLLPVEQKARERVAARIKELDLDLKRAGTPERMLPLEPLGWRWPNGLPKLALLSLGCPTFNITARHSDGFTIHPDLPTKIKRMYRDVGKLAEDYCIRRDSMRSYTYTFNGVIPASVRASIVEAMQSCRFDGLYMLVETPQEAWRVETKKGVSRRQVARENAARMRASLANIDPLILGWAAESLWVIDKFDLTTLEQYVLDEFSQKALLPGS